MSTETKTADWRPLPRAGSRVILTGAAGGMGRALFQALTEVGCEVIGLDVPAALARLPAGGPWTEARTIGVDLGDAEAAQAAVREAVGRLGGSLDALVGAAGIVDTVHRAATFPLAAFRRDVEVNLLGQFYIAQAAYPALKTGTSPTIVFISSVAGQDGLPGQAAYAAAKGGVIGLTRTLAAEWARDGIRVNVVVPGLVATEKVEAMPETARTRLLSQVPLGRSASLPELVGTVAYLLSPAAGCSTGLALRLDGGSGLWMSGFFR